MATSNMMTDEENADRNAKRRAYYVRRRDYLLALNTAQRVKRQKAEGRYTEHDVRRIWKDQRASVDFARKNFATIITLTTLPVGQGRDKLVRITFRFFVSRATATDKAAKDPIVFAQRER